MRIILKSIYVITVVFIILFFVFMFLFKVMPLEFANSSSENIYDNFLFWGVPLIILLTISKIGFKENINWAHVKTIIAGRVIICVVYVIFFFIYALSSFGSGMCGWSSGEIIFRNKINKSIRIEIRYFGCGATDSSPATPKIFKIRNITPFFIYAQKIDTSKITEDEWERIYSVTSN